MPRSLEAQPGAIVTTAEGRFTEMGESLLRMKRPVARRNNAPIIMIPFLKMSVVRSAFSLADITDTDRIRKLGASLATDPEAELARTVVSASVVVGADGIKRTQLVTSPAADRVQAVSPLFGLMTCANSCLSLFWYHRLSRQGRRSAPQGRRSSKHSWRV